jgi:hypothetical protein
MTMNPDNPYAAPQTITTQKRQNHGDTEGIQSGTEKRVSLGE